MIDPDDFDDDDIDDGIGDDFDPEELREPDELAERVGWAYCVNIWDPGHPLVMFGGYEGIRRLGAGSYGWVFLARDPKLEREVAIKLCKVADEEHRDRLLREAQLIARLSGHPNVVTIHELGCFESTREDDELDGAPFIVMELAVGLPGLVEDVPPIRTGKELLLRRELHWADCVEFYRGAGRGLAAAHAKGIVHGDFKPSNVLIGKSGAMVADFGLAHTLGSAEEHGGGTVGYRAPELLGGGGNSPKADQWAFCASLWELIVGVLPFDHESGEPNLCPPGLMPRRLILALLRGLSANAEERWPSMEDLLEELGQILAQPSPPEHRRPRGRLPRGFLVYTMLGGLLGALFIALLMDRPQQRAELREYPSTEPSTERIVKPELEKKREGPLAQQSERVSKTEESNATNIASRGPHCVLDGAPTTNVSPELEAVCVHIREGRFKKASDRWQEIRATLEPESGIPDDVRRERYTALERETRIVASTFADEGKSLKSRGGKPDLIKAARLSAKRWDTIADLDKLAANK